MLSTPWLAAVDILLDLEEYAASHVAKTSPFCPASWTESHQNRKCRRDFARLAKATLAKGWQGYEGEVIPNDRESLIRLDKMRRDLNFLKSQLLTQVNHLKTFGKIVDKHIQIIDKYYYGAFLSSGFVSVHSNYAKTQSDAYHRCEPWSAKHGVSRPR
ncbi:copper-translocating P-type ATPase [Piscirickettsia salmonis]|uniref:Copper-translocating P-type ATPase n=1 Tax=Piscirickettsia salmonis TaxID=1238 RepID=A0AAC8VHN0_PISSA|nr:hypothetical protein [Piscirickettsia salmonis]AKP73582.1 hypothetical protein PSLF89_1743 [Piscirickettsia salmonis LF-89 = ATCC VR-1361]ALB22341.1 copper-translocating P-type ATPase [Piscirickettsia salmonis]ALY02424.1 hypothetical protein AWE47_05790 [Piscirickettsia salmonis]APS73097.1 hypothetical protein AVM70_05755 [Piscirickettsia salmonis]APS82834.1 hypothetical protein AVM71_05900 [Piscirickettsia salmonis]